MQLFHNYMAYSVLCTVGWFKYHDCCIKRKNKAGLEHSCRLRRNPTCNLTVQAPSIKLIMPYNYEIIASIQINSTFLNRNSIKAIAVISVTERPMLMSRIYQ